MDYWLSFLGLWLADGHCRGTNGGEKDMMQVLSNI